MDDRTLSDTDFDVTPFFDAFLITFGGRMVATAPNISLAVVRLHLARTTRNDLLARFFAKDA